MAVKKRDIPKPPKSVASARPPKAPKARAATAVPAKNFKIEEWGNETSGIKVVLHADSGMGKTTLVTMAPKPVFIGTDDGGREIRNPKTGKKLKHIPGVNNFLDVRAALQAPLYDGCESVVIDTITILEEWAEQHVLDTITNDSGETMSSIVKYGWSNGYKHLYDTMKLVLQDCDALIRRGKNVILIAQSTPHNVPNPGGEDFIRQGPRLVSRKNANIEALYCEWADHIFYIGYRFLNVDKKKKATGTGDRAVFVHPEPHFRAKSRTLGLDKATVSFADPTDDSIWQFLFDGEI